MDGVRSVGPTEGFFLLIHPPFVRRRNSNRVGEDEAEDMSRVEGNSLSLSLSLRHRNNNNNNNNSKR